MEIKDLIGRMGFKPEDFGKKEFSEITADEYMTKVNERFIRRDNAHTDDELVNKIVGHRMQSIEVAVKRGAKELGLELKDEDFKDAKWTTDKVEVAFGKIKDYHTSKVTELTNLANSKGSDAVKEWQNKHAELEKKFNETNSLLDSTKNEFNTYKENEKKNARTKIIQESFSTALSKAPFKDGLTEIERIGFEGKFTQKYGIQLDEQDKPYLFDKQTNARIKSTRTAGDFMSIEEAIESEVKALNLDKKNPHAGSVKTTVIPNHFSENKAEEHPVKPGGFKPSKNFTQKVTPP